MHGREPLMRHVEEIIAKSTCRVRVDVDLEVGRQPRRNSKALGPGRFPGPVALGLERELCLSVAALCLAEERAEYCAETQKAPSDVLFAIVPDATDNVLQVGI